MWHREDTKGHARFISQVGQGMQLSRGDTQTGEQKALYRSMRMHGGRRYCADWVGYMDVQVVNTSIKDMGEDV